MADQFDNGRTPEQLERSFRNSTHVCFALDRGEIVGKGRLLSDGVCNAYLIDLWTRSSHRNRGIARRIVEILSSRVAGHHMYLQADDDLVGFYEKLGFFRHPNGMAKVIGHWLQSSG